MRKHLLACAALAAAASAASPKSFAEMYQWTEPDGSEIISSEPRVCHGANWSSESCLKWREGERRATQRAQPRQAPEPSKAESLLRKLRELDAAIQADSEAKIEAIEARSQEFQNEANRLIAERNRQEKEKEKELAFAAMRGEVLPGMDERQVRRAWGNPRDITRYSSTSGTSQTWWYGTGGVWFTDGVVDFISETEDTTTRKKKKGSLPGRPMW